MVRAEHVTRCLPVLPNYHPRGGAVLFRDVLRHTVRHLTEPDAVTAWIRWWLRYALGGRCSDESLLFLYGLPGTGKSTVADTVAAAAGGYADTVSAERLVGDGSQHRQWLARLEGARVVRCNELPRNGGAWRTEDLLALVSGETLEANRMRANSFTFRSQAKLLLPAAGGRTRRRSTARCAPRCDCGAALAYRWGAWWCGPCRRWWCGADLTTVLFVPSSQRPASSPPLRSP